MPRGLDDVAHHCGGRGQRTGPLTEEHRLSHGIPDHVDRVVDAVDVGERVTRADHRGLDAHVHAPAGTLGNRQQLDLVAGLTCIGDVAGSDRLDAFGRHIGERHAGVERDRGQDRDLGRGVETVHIGGGIRFGESALLRFRQRARVVETVLGHPREHVVGGSVDDAVDRLDLVAHEAVLERVDDRYAAAHARLEQDVDTLLGGSIHHLAAVCGHERLVRGDHGLAGAERVKDHLACHARTADEFHDDVDPRVPDDVCRLGGEAVRPQPELRCARGVAVGALHERDVHAGARTELPGVALEDLHDAAADCPQADQADVDGAHESSASLEYAVIVAESRPPMAPDTSDTAPTTRQMCSIALLMPMPERSRRAGCAPQPSSVRRRSSYVSRRTAQRHCPSRTNTTPGRTCLL